MYKTVIIDDDLNGIKAIQNMFDQFGYPAEVVGTAQSIQEGIPILNETKPDLLFLDIEMKNESGFDLLDVWNNDDTKVIFCTGYDQYAIKALKNGAYDYILKPLDYKEFSELFKKLDSISDVTSPNSSSEEKDKERLVVKSLGGMHIIDFCDINYLKADGRYTEISYGEAKKCVSSKNIGSFDGNLKCARFVKLNKSVIINQDQLRGVEKRGNSSHIIFKNDELEVSDSLRKNIMKLLE
jgi:two-component system LytT family response regulator